MRGGSGEDKEKEGRGGAPVSAQHLQRHLHLLASLLSSCSWKPPLGYYRGIAGRNPKFTENANRNLRKNLYLGVVSKVMVKIPS